MTALHVAGVGLYVPEPTPVAEVAASGAADWRTIRRTGLRSVAVAAESGPDLAVRAARAALAAAGRGPGDVDLVLHASTYFQGHDLWAPASYVQRRALGNACPSVGVGQLSNGGMAALELAASHLRAEPARHSVLITTGDRFCPPGFDRWHTDPGTVCGDGGTAAVLSRRGGFARLLGLVTVSDPELEELGRGADPFAAAALAARRPIDLDAHRPGLLRRYGMTALLDRIRAGQRRAYDGALAAAGVGAREIDRFVLPNLGLPRVRHQFLEPLDVPLERTAWEWGRTVGHLGAGDQFGGLAHLRRAGALRPGQLCALVGAGAGFAWSTAILRIEEAAAAGED
ncbi:3-oxoacyl-ACP synthase [Pilimelia anulata]|uniref:3-oxoacyl-ACP synthase n=1 Tax=Pilimelia anulata TaxID=53371 RepID=A0A8J3B5C0_9ACTN|nr:ketoacyl-ACP synthase III family protein [Pilimelia anulata]GGJ96675.1 3-oxoacyl-ACP synthase [Pilimelia anulata]